MPRILQRRIFLPWAVVIALAPAQHAHAIAGDSDKAVGFDGSFRTITAATANYAVEGAPQALQSDGHAQTLLRLVLAGRPSAKLSYEAHLVHDLTMQSRALPGGLSAASGMRYRALDERWRWLEDGVVGSGVTLDRLNIKLALPFADITVGRQAITFGKTYFWNPLDVFLAFDPTAFDREYKRGVDALRVEIPLGYFSGVSLVGALGRPQGGHSFYRSALIGRVFTTHFDWDFSAQGGKVYGGYHLGGGAGGELGPIEARFELGYFWPTEYLRPVSATPMPQGLSAVVGVGRYFNVFERTLALQAEYLFNGRAAADVADSFLWVAKGFLRQASPHAVGGTVSYALTPLLRGSLATIVGIAERPSLIVQPGFVYSAADEVELTAGALLAFGARPKLDAGANLVVQSEFGAYPHMFYVETKIYF